MIIIYGDTGGSYTLSTPGQYGNLYTTTDHEVVQKRFKYAISSSCDHEHWVPDQSLTNPRSKSAGFDLFYAFVFNCFATFLSHPTIATSLPRVATHVAQLMLH